MVLAAIALSPGPSWADVELPRIFASHMVLQRDQRVPVWGRAQPGERVTVEVAGQSHTTLAGQDGSWRIEIDPIETSPDPLTVVVRGENTVVLEDVLVGEVWLCGGQSNMALPVAFANDSKAELLDTGYPSMRLYLALREKGGATWRRSSRGAAEHFSAICYFFGRALHRTLRVPVGMIQTAWANSTCESWISRETLEGDPRFRPLLHEWARREAAAPDPQREKEELVAARLVWFNAKQVAEAEGRPVPPSPTPRKANLHASPRRPGNLYARFVRALAGYGMRGVLWYQGESNTFDPVLYRELFPVLIRDWRSQWRRSDLPFYWIQLPARGFGPAAHGSNWARVRDAQTMVTQALPHTAQAVTIDLRGPLHPKNKQDFAARLLRIALAREYGRKVAYRNPVLEKMETREGKVLLTFADVGGGLTVGDGSSPLGFAVAGSARKYFAADARIVAENRVEVWADAVAEPVAVRYAWANNPPTNLFTAEGLPVTPFRTDDWPVPTSESDSGTGAGS